MLSNSSLEMAEHAKELALKIGKAMGNVNRLALLATIFDRGKASHKDLMFNSYAPMNPASVKHHIKVLRETGFVEENEYSLTPLGRLLSRPFSKDYGPVRSVEDYLNIILSESEEIQTV